MKKYLYVLLPLVAVAVFRMNSFFLAAHEGRISFLPASAKKLTTFNNLSGFKPDPGNPRSFIYVSNIERVGDCYLRFAISDFDPSPYRLLFRLKSRADLLKKSKVKMGQNMWGSAVVNGDMATYNIPMRDSKAFLWNDGRCYVGVFFPNVALKLGDVVELVDFKFELAR